MLQEYKETWLDIFGLWKHPHQTYQALMKKPLTLRPFLINTCVLFVCSLLSGIYLHMQAQNFTGDVNAMITEIANTDMLQYCIAIFFAPVISILAVSIMMFIMGTLARSTTSFKQNVVLVSYAWTPMLIASVITTIFAYVYPIQTSMLAQNIFDYLIPIQFHHSFLYQFLSQIDPFYIWSLLLLAMGASYLYGKGGKWWYLIIFGIMELPVLITWMGG